MIVIESYGVAVVMLVVTMLCWGSWANTQKLASKEWAFQLYYWDYAIGVFLFSLALAFTMGSIGAEGRSFLPDLAQATSNSIMLAFIGGVIFNLSNILLVGAIDIAGMAVAFPIGVGLALVIGVVTNYMAAPVGNATFLFLGVGLVTVAIVLDAMAYKRLPSHSTATSKGILMSVAAGVIMGFFYRFVAASMSTDFVNLTPGKMGPYAALVVFSFGLLTSNFVWNTYFMKKPLSGSAVTYGDYLTRGSSRLHAIGILGGVIWSVGMAFSIITAGAAGFAISYGLGQGATLIGAFWGVFIWKEFKDAPAGTGNLLNAMFLFYFVGLAFVIYARVA